MTTPATLSSIENDFVVDLSGTGIIKLTGEQRRDYLDSQMTAEVESLTPELATYTCHCNAKGKMHSISILLEHEDSLLLIGNSQGLANSLPELKKYAVFSKVDIIDDSEQWLRFGVGGDKAMQALGFDIEQLPDENLAVTQTEHGIIIRMLSDKPLYMVMLAENAPRPEVNSVQKYSEAAWEALLISAGIPVVTEATAAEYVPQMLNMQALDAISFTKGCYMGQETVARTRYLGKNKRAAFILHAHKPIDCQPGDTIEIDLGETWRRGGNIIRQASLGDESWALAVMNNDTQASSMVRLKTSPEDTFTVKSVPYSITE